MKKRKVTSPDILGRIMDIQDKLAKLPPLSSVKKAQLEQSLAIEQLYYSSKLEGTTLTEKMIEHAIHGPELSAPQN
jgi:Fic family protein